MVMNYSELKKDLLSKLSLEEKCPCGQRFETHPDEPQYKINKKVVCGDCYFDSLGDPWPKRKVILPH